MDQLKDLSSDDVGTPVEGFIGPGLPLMEQELLIKGGTLKLITPRNVDSVIDLYISGKSNPGATLSLEENACNKIHSCLGEVYCCCSSIPTYACCCKSA